MIIGSRYHIDLINESPMIWIGSNNIKRVSNKNSLGMIIDEQLKWDNDVTM